jgi:hypothetical protein
LRAVAAVAAPLGIQAAFASDKIGHNTAINDAFIVIYGEPMTQVSDEMIV